MMQPTSAPRWFANTDLFLTSALAWSLAVWWCANDSRFAYSRGIQNTWDGATGAQDVEESMSRKVLAVILCLTFAVPLVGQKIESPAHQFYEELFTANDLAVTQGTYACFYDSAERAKIFFIISVHLYDQKTMYASVVQFSNGVASSNPQLFEGKLLPFSSSQRIFAKLPTSYDYEHSLDKSHVTDTFDYNSGDISIKTGFGELSNGQARMTYEFKMQHSTGRFVEEVKFNGGVKPDGFTTEDTGKCLRVLHSRTPEDDYNSVVPDITKSKP
jgi:hypothetical protein